MNAKELKHEIKAIFGESIIFNKEFKKHALRLEGQEQSLLLWCKLLKEGRIKHFNPPKNKGSIVFIKKIGSSNRCIVLKIKNGVFTECHLGDHKYYDELRKILGL